MRMNVSYATMSYLRELVKKDQLRHFTNLAKNRFDNVSPEGIQDQWDKFWKFHDIIPQISNESCMVAILKECDRIENECQKALGMVK